MTNEAQHTPGPWVVGYGEFGVTGGNAVAAHHDEDGGAVPLFCGDPGWPHQIVSGPAFYGASQTIAVVPAAWDPDSDERVTTAVPGSDVANARLIAAAPDLLEALRVAAEVVCRGECDRASDWHSPACETNRAAIAKAVQP